MQSKTSKDLEKRQKKNEPENDIVEIRYVPLPPEKVEAYQVAIRILAKMLIELQSEQCEVVSDQLNVEK